MLKNYALISDGTVKNVIVIDDEKQDSLDFLALITPNYDHVFDIDTIDTNGNGGKPGVGYSYDGTTWTAPPTPEPEF